MQVMLNQSEIEEAVRSLVTSQIDVKEGQNIHVDLKAGRGPDGFTATLEITTNDTPSASVDMEDDPAEKPVTKPKAAAKPKAVTKAKLPEPDPEPEAVPEDAVKEEETEEVSKLKAVEPVNDPVEESTAEVSDKPSIFSFNKKA